ncbi:hypothetical protein CYMTET_52138 [Cymbomonas tetramitiformis]|uniref:RAVE complex protein Rav1 C-terminal domain-containing protein n=1 Tax=Cymbomonas tetramitiformis TaxID=36881 RepID=A0AAE0BJR0_9CHLO|nr:hypothetical protein CYMTET_52138 [Cymbomonas tetramitiformis]
MVLTVAPSMDFPVPRPHSRGALIKGSLGYPSALPLIGPFGIPCAGLVVTSVPALQMCAGASERPPGPGRAPNSGAVPSERQLLRLAHTWGKAGGDVIAALPFPGKPSPGPSTASQTGLLEGCAEDEDRAGMRGLQRLRLAFWMRSVEALQKWSESAAKRIFAATRDPHECALLYLALGRRTVLGGLFKAVGNTKLAEFMGRDFAQERHRTAALKNGYTLMGQGRHELAAAFFVLGGSLSDAVATLKRSSQPDPSLALLVCRLAQPAGRKDPWGPALGADGVKLVEGLLAEGPEHAAAGEGDEAVWHRAALLGLVGRHAEALAAVEEALDKGGGSSSGATQHSLGAFCVFLLKQPVVSSAVRTTSLRTRRAALQSALSYSRAGLSLLALESMPSPCSDAQAQSGSLVRQSSGSGQSGTRASQEADSSGRMAGVPGVSQPVNSGMLNMDSFGGVVRGRGKGDPFGNSSGELDSGMLNMDSRGDNFGGGSGRARGTPRNSSGGAGQRHAEHGQLRGDSFGGGSGEGGNRGDPFGNSSGELDSGMLNMDSFGGDNFGGALEVVRGRGPKGTPEYSGELDSGMLNMDSRSGELDSGMLNMDSFGSDSFGGGSRGGGGVKGDPFGNSSGELDSGMLNMDSFGPSSLGGEGFLGASDLACPLVDDDPSESSNSVHSVHVRPSCTDHVSGELDFDSFGGASFGGASDLASGQLDSGALVGEDLEALAAEDSVAARGLSAAPHAARQHTAPCSTRGEEKAVENGLLTRIAAQCLVPYALQHLQLSPDHDLSQAQESAGSSSGEPASPRRHLTACAHALDGALPGRQLNVAELVGGTLEWSASLEGAEVKPKPRPRGAPRGPLTPLSKPASVPISPADRPQPSGALSPHQSTSGPRTPPDGSSPHRGGSSAGTPTTPPLRSSSYSTLLSAAAKLRPSSPGSPPRRPSIGRHQSEPDLSYPNSERRAERLHAEGVGSEGPLGAGIEVMKMTGDLLLAVAGNVVDPLQLAVATDKQGLVLAAGARLRKGARGSSILSYNGPGRRDGEERGGWVTDFSEGLVQNSWGSSTSIMAEAPLWSTSQWPPEEWAFNDDAAALAAAATGAGNTHSPDVVAPTLAAHPRRPLLLSGSSTGMVHLWHFGQSTALAAYGVHSPRGTRHAQHSDHSIRSIRFDRYGSRFVTASATGSTATWRLEVGALGSGAPPGPTEVQQCFETRADDVMHVGSGGSVLVVAGHSAGSLESIVLCDTLQPPRCARVAATPCHEGGARCLARVPRGGGAYGELIASGGLHGDVALHDLRRVGKGAPPLWHTGESCSGEVHAGAVVAAVAVPKGTAGDAALVTAGKDGNLRVWDVAGNCIQHICNAHLRHTFISPRCGGAMVQAAVTDVHSLDQALLTCGGDGIIKMWPYCTR